MREEAEPEEEGEQENEAGGHGEQEEEEEEKEENESHWESVDDENDVGAEEKAEKIADPSEEDVSDWETIGEKEENEERLEREAFNKRDLKFEDLVYRLGNLPEELQRKVFVFTVLGTCDRNGIIHINKDYKPPVGLQLNRRYRKRFARDYYGRGNIFQVDWPDPSSTKPSNNFHSGLAQDRDHLNWDTCDWAFRTLRLWFRTLERRHSNQSDTIRLDGKRPDACSGRTYWHAIPRAGYQRWFFTSQVWETPWGLGHRGFYNSVWDSRRQGLDCLVPDGVLALRVPSRFAPDLLYEWYVPGEHPRWHR